MDDRTAFAIGSQTKAFTAAALAILVDDEKILWDDAVTKYLRGFQLADPFVTTQLTIRDLVTHRRGLPGNNLIFWGTNVTRGQIVERLRFLQPTAGLRSRYQYQNLLFITAGEIIPVVTGKTWDDFVREDPCAACHEGERDQRRRYSSDPARQMAIPHARYSGQLAPVTWLNLDNAGPDAMRSIGVMMPERGIAVEVLTNEGLSEVLGFTTPLEHWHYDTFRVVGQGPVAASLGRLITFSADFRPVVSQLRIQGGGGASFSRRM